MQVLWTADQRFRNGSKTVLKRLGVSNGFPVSYLNTEVKKIPAVLLIAEVLMDSNNV